MNTIDNGVLNKNSLRFRYQEKTPFFEIKVDSELFFKFQTDHRLDMMATLLPDNSMKLTIRLKSFRSTVNFNTILPSWNKHDKAIHNFVSSFVLLEKIKIKITTYHQEHTYEKMITLPSAVRSIGKIYIGQLLAFQKNDGLEETFKELPVGFLVPYANPSYFLFLCKIEDNLYEKIKFISLEELDFQVSFNYLSIAFSISYQGFTLSSLTIKKEDICSDIIEDFKILLKHRKIDIAITNHSLTNQQYLKFTKELHEGQLHCIHDFFFRTPLSKETSNIRKQGQ
jgi:hypothetical protein